VSTDAGALTVLLQEQIPGLQVYSGSKQDSVDGRWVSVPPVEGALTINTGETFMIYGIIMV
jgi:isopenicillin N synthase-like dioxygenase